MRDLTGGKPHKMSVFWLRNQVSSVFKEVHRKVVTAFGCLSCTSLEVTQLKSLVLVRLGLLRVTLGIQELLCFHDIGSKMP